MEIRYRFTSKKDEAGIEVFTCHYSCFERDFFGWEIGESEETAFKRVEHVVKTNYGDRIRLVPFDF